MPKKYEGIQDLAKKRKSVVKSQRQAREKIDPEFVEERLKKARKETDRKETDRDDIKKALDKIVEEERKQRPTEKPEEAKKRLKKREEMEKKQLRERLKKEKSKEKDSEEIEVGNEDITEEIHLLTEKKRDLFEINNETLEKIVGSDIVVEGGYFELEDKKKVIKKQKEDLDNLFKDGIDELHEKDPNSYPFTGEIYVNEQKDLTLMFQEVEKIENEMMDKFGFNVLADKWGERRKALKGLSKEEKEKFKEMRADYKSMAKAYKEKVEDHAEKFDAIKNELTPKTAMRVAVKGALARIGKIESDVKIDYEKVEKIEEMNQKQKDAQIIKNEASTDKYYKNGIDRLHEIDKSKYPYSGEQYLNSEKNLNLVSLELDKVEKKLMELDYDITRDSWLKRRAMKKKLDIDEFDTFENLVQAHKKLSKIYDKELKGHCKKFSKTLEELTPSATYRTPHTSASLRPRHIW